MSVGEMTGLPSIPQLFTMTSLIYIRFQWLLSDHAVKFTIFYIRLDKVLCARAYTYTYAYLCVHAYVCICAHMYVCSCMHTYETIKRSLEKKNSISILQAPNETHILAITKMENYP